MKVLIRTSMILAMLCSLSILHAQTWCAMDWTLTSSSTSIASTISPSGIKLNNKGTAETNVIAPALTTTANGAITFRLDAWGAASLSKPYINIKYLTSSVIYNIRIQQDSIKIISTPKLGGTTTVGIKLSATLVAGTSLIIEKSNGVLGVKYGAGGGYLASVSMGTYANQSASISLSMYGQAGLQISNSLKSFGCPNIAYAQLSNQIGSGFFTMPIGTNELYFQFKQEYDPQSPIQTYAIYDNKASRIPVISGSFSVQYGNNWVNANVSALESGVYMLEFTANKGEKYYLRFKKQ